ncbi:MAG TPA: type III secretion protein HrpB4 [Burkholderiaceae bacterium]
MDAPEALRRLLAAARAKSADAAAQLHPHWRRAGLRKLGLADAHDDSGAEPRWSAPLAALYGLGWPAIDRFERPAHRVALLPRAELARVLAAVALDAERARVRLCIGHALRNAMIDRVGEPAYASMLESRPLQGARLTALTLAELEPERLAAAGAARLVAAGWRSERLLKWVRLALAPAAAPVPAPAREAGFLERLPTYFPEHAWLFGSSMDRALSASTTA